MDPAHKTKLDEHERELVGVRVEISHLSQGLDDVRNSLGRQSGKLDEMLAYITSTRVVTIDHILKVMQVIVFGVIIMGSVVGSIVYVAGNANSVQMALMQNNLNRLQSVLGWTLTVNPTKDPQR